MNCHYEQCPNNRLNECNGAVDSHKTTAPLEENDRSIALGRAVDFNYSAMNEILKSCVPNTLKLNHLL